jgi:methylmalonyl-CoA mutase N-terminal domain/subunit
VERGDRIVVGVNQHEVEEEEPEIFRPDPAERAGVLQTLERVRAERDGARVEGTLRAVEEAARGTANLMEPILAAVEARATLGEVSTALEGVFGRFQPPEVV